MIRVRRAIQEDLPAISEFVKLAYPQRWMYKYPERWQWEYVDNPFLDGSGLPVFLAEDERGKVVGQTCTLMEPLKLGNRVCRVGWGVDSFVLPEYRGQGIGSQLQKANHEFNEIFMSLDMAPTNRRIKARLGSAPLAAVPIYYRLVRYQPESLIEALRGRVPGQWLPLRLWLPELLRRSGADRLGVAVKNGLYSLRDRRLLGKDAPDLEIAPIPCFGEEFDRLWDAVSPHYFALVQRKAVYLNWKYIQQPFMDYQRFAARRRGELCGYVVLRTGRPPEPNLGVLADLFAAPQDPEAVTALLAYAIRFFRRAGVKDILTATSVPAFQAVFERLGFQQIGETVPMFHCRTPGLACQDIVEPGRWLLSKADHDWDQYPLAR